MVLRILEMVFPVLLMMGLGCFCARRGILSAEGIAGIKKVVGSVILPVVLFNAFFTAEYSKKILIVFAAVYCACAAALGVGFLVRGAAKPHGRYAPFLMTNFEGGMLGYALFGLLYAGRTDIFAMVDIGQTLSAFTLYLAVLQAVGTGRAEPKQLLKSTLTNPCLIGTALGVVLGAVGVGEWIRTTPLDGLVSKTISFVTAPASGLILLAVGGELSLRRDIMRPVLITSLLRVIVMGAVFGIASFVIFRLIPFEKPLFAALLLGAALPAPYILPIYNRHPEEGHYISTTLSVQTIISVVLFIGIAAYTLA